MHTSMFRTPLVVALTNPNDHSVCKDVTEPFSILCTTIFCQFNASGS